MLLYYMYYLPFYHHACRGGTMRHGPICGLLWYSAVLYHAYNRTRVKLKARGSNPA